MKKAIIFNIQKFSLHDGPGIRTVVFFKGCPLSCKWCSNPESQNPKIETFWNQGKESIEGEEKTVDDVMHVCLQDRDFYEESHGGVTLSGGEVLAQPAFAIELLKELKKEGIHTALETTGFATPDIFEAVTKHADLLLFDMKHWQEEKHIEGTGVSNKQILENMKSAISRGIDVLPRLPIIPNFNNSLEDAAGFVSCLKEIGATKAQLLPFHQFGENKYEKIDKTYEYKDVPALHEEDLEEYRQVFIDGGIDAFF